MSRLQWRLTFSYAGVTVAAFLVLQILLLAAALFFVNLLYLFPNAIAENSLKITDQFRQPLASSTPNEEVLNVQLRQIKDDVETSGTARNGLGFMLQTSSEQRIVLGIVDAEGKTIASTPENALPGGEKLSNMLSEVSNKCLTQALAGDTSSERLSTREADGTIISIVPIQSEENQILGAFFVRIYAPFEWQTFFSNVIYRMLPATVGVGVFVGIVGTIFGFVQARKLTKRLNAVSLAAAGWSKGDFSLLAPESPGDELSELGENLNQMAQSLKDLISVRQELAALRERQRLARDLHDTVKQQIFSCAMQLAAARKWIKKDADIAAERLEETEKIVKNIQGELAAVLQELRPLKSAENLAELLRDYLSDWMRQHGIVAEFCGETKLITDGQTAQAFYRIAQEALANVARHSGARKVSLELKRDGNKKLQLTIKDDGTGFDEKSEFCGMGLKNMAERAAALPGGKFSIRSQPGKGTSLAVCCVCLEEGK